MKGRSKPAIGTAAWLVLSSAGWLAIGCDGDVIAENARDRHQAQELGSEAATTRDDAELRYDDADPRDGARRPDAAEQRGDRPPRRGGSRRGGSFFDRLLGERTREVIVPPGTIVELRFTETISSRVSARGDAVRTTVEQDVRIGDALAIPAGSVAVGRVTEAHQPRQVGGRARLSLEFTELELPSGASAPIDGRFVQRGKSEILEDAAIIAGSTVGGVVLGEAVDEGEGGVIGGILGGIGGAVAAKTSKAKPVEVPAGTVMAVELVRPVTLEVPA